VETEILLSQAAGRVAPSQQSASSIMLLWVKFSLKSFCP